MHVTPVTLTPALIESFSGVFLSPRYDNPVTTPDFHREGWAAYVSMHPQVVLVAPRDHAKSTAFTFDYILAETLFRTSDYVILIGSTEDKAAEQLSNIGDELRTNEDLIREFGVAEFEADTKTDIIVKMDDGYRFRVLARGAEQKIRGAMWKGKRPNLLVCDDMEDDEQVESRDRRVKFRRWFFRAAKQALSRTGRIRVHGTILHEDSLLSRLLKNKTWEHLFYRAHASFDDFSEILWPAAWSAARLRARRQEFIEDGDAAGYSQEFLNDPFDNSEAYLRKDDFLSMKEEDYETEKVVVAAWDFAISKADKANRTSCTVGGKDLANTIHVIDQRVGRKDALEIVDEMFMVEIAHTPVCHFVEGGQIWNALEPMVRREMQIRDRFMNIQIVNSTKDKAAKGRPFQKRHRARAMRFDKQAEWYAPYEAELLRFTGNSEALLDDQFDSTSLLVKGYELLPEVEEDDFDSDNELEMRRQDPRKLGGRSQITGY